MKFISQPSPATEQEIQLWEKYFQLKMPQDLNDLLKKSNGPILYDQTIKKELQFLSTQDAIDFHEDYGLNTLEVKVILILLDGSSNFAVYQVHESKVESIYALPCGSLWDDSVKISKNIEGLLQDKTTIETYLGY